MQEAQGSIAKDTAAVCAATMLLVVLLIGAAFLWPSPPQTEGAAHAQLRLHGPRVRLPVETAEATPRTPTPPFVF